MSWLKYHELSEQYAIQAERLSMQGQHDRAIELYCLAAKSEEKALEALAPHKTRTFGVTAVSTASLYFKAREFKQAKRIAHNFLTTELLPLFAVEQLLELIRAMEQRKD